MMRQCILAIVMVTIFFAEGAYAGISFLKKTVVITDDKEDVLLQQKFYSEGEMIRIEEESAGIEGNPGVRIYDFEKKKLYTIMLDVKLYIEQDIKLEKEAVMFEIPPEKRYANYKDIKVVRTKQGEDTIEGHSAVRYEVKVIRKGEKGKEKEDQVVEKYRLWLAEDLKEMPVKYEFEFPNNSKKIINYLDIKNEAIDPSLFSVPQGYVPISPF